MKFTAKHRFARISPRKIQPITSMIKNKYVDEALDNLKFTNRRGANFLYKVLSSAVANAGDDVKIEDYKVSVVSVNKGPAYKRYMPAAMGRAVPRKKRTSHILVEISDEC